jgi:hypothetical protein
MKYREKETSGLIRMPGRLSPRQEVERRKNGGLIEGQETLLAVYRASREVLIYCYKGGDV